MHRISGRLLILLLITKTSTPVLASIPDNLTVPFYRSMDSSFPSGQATYKQLSESKTEQINEAYYLARKDNRDVKINTDHVFRDLHTSTIVHDLVSKKDYPIEKVDGAHVHVKGPAGILKLKTEQSIPAFTDLGLAVLLRESTLKSKPLWKADNIYNAEAGEKFRIRHIGADWIEVNPLDAPERVGYLPLGLVVTKYDFAAFVYITEGWVPVRFRQNNYMLKNDNSRIPIEQISAIITHADLLISRTQNHELKYREQYRMLGLVENNWQNSQLRGHGNVYWRTNSIQNAIAEAAKSKLIQTEDLVKKSIYSMSFHPKNSNIGIVSARGVYLTADGKTWKKLDYFSENNWPVLITQDGKIYVGDQVSTNYGESFSHYFRWTTLAQEFNKLGMDSYRGLKIKSLNEDSKGQLQLQIQAGNQVLSLARRPTQQGNVDRWEIQ